jgi:multiple sugar transport system permease protein
MAKTARGRGGVVSARRASATTAAGPKLRHAPPRRGRGLRGALEPVAWVTPSVLLILIVIAFPAVEMVRSSFLRITQTGLATGGNGLGNYQRLLREPALPSVVWHTILWVVLVVGVTVLVSLPVAQFLDKPFAGRQLVRLAVVVPWAASLVMTATVWRYIYEGAYGPLNRLLMDLGLLHQPVEWYKDARFAFWGLIVIAIIVSIPFTTYVFLAGLQTIPGELYEAARIDGAGPWQVYRRVTLPLLRPSLLVAVVLNAIYVFNSFPIIWLITGKIPGYDTDTTITFMYKVAFGPGPQLDAGEAAALAVLNVLFLLLVVTVYLRHVTWDETEVSVASTRESTLIRLSRPAAGLLRRAAGGAAAALRPAGRLPSRAMRAAGRGVGAAWRPLRPAGLPAIGAVVALFFLAPYAVMFLGALKSDQDLFSIPARYLPTRWEWSNFVSVWSQIHLLAYLRATLAIAGVTTLIVLVVSVPAAWFTARHRFRGRSLFLYLILVTQMFAPVALVVGLYREYALVDNFFANLGVGLRATSSFWAIILVYSAFNLAFAVWILSGYFRSIPKEIEEAALIDGLSRFRALLRVVLPLAKPGVVTAVVFTFIQVWNEFVVALTLFNDPTRNRQTLTVGIQQFVGLYETHYQYLFVASLIGIVPVVILFMAIERYLMGGLTAGSVK